MIFRRDRVCEKWKGYNRGEALWFRITAAPAPCPKASPSVRLGSLSHLSPTAQASQDQLPISSQAPTGSYSLPSGTNRFAPPPSVPSELDHTPISESPQPCA